MVGVAGVLLTIEVAAAELHAVFTSSFDKTSGTCH